jgi:hypothetical protein
MKTILTLWLLVGCLLPSHIHAQTVTGNLSNGGTMVIVTINGRLDTFRNDCKPCTHSPLPPASNTGNAGDYGANAGGDEIGTANVGKTVVHEHNATIINKTVIRRERKKERSRGRRVRQSERKSDKRERKRDRLTRKREKSNERRAGGKGKGRKVVKKVVRGIGDGVAAVGEGAAMVAYGIGTGLVETAKFLARPFEKCDCDGRGNGNNRRPKSKPAKPDKPRVLSRHGRRVKDAPRRRVSRVKKSDR